MDGEYVIKFRLETVENKMGKECYCLLFHILKQPLTVKFLIWIHLNQQHVQSYKSKRFPEELDVPLKM